MDVFSRWAGETTNEIDMHLHHFNMLDTSIENKKPTTIACHIVKMKKKILYGCFAKIVLDLNNIAT